MKKKIAILLGATGLTGSYLLDILLNSDGYEKVRVFTRKTTLKKNDKLEEIICDLLRLEKYSDNFYADEVFCCIGTIRAKTPDKKLYRDIDLGIPLSAAKLSQKNNIKTFSVISAIGANKNSPIFYSRTKGEMEEAILKYSIPNILIYRPSLIFGKRKDSRYFEKMGLFFTKIVQIFLLGRLKNYKAINAQDLAKAMFLNAQEKTGHHIMFKNDFEKE